MKVILYSENIVFLMKWNVYQTLHLVQINIDIIEEQFIHVFIHVVSRLHNYNL